jgi:general secretion pathway protein E
MSGDQVLWQAETEVQRHEMKAVSPRQSGARDRNLRLATLIQYLIDRDLISEAQLDRGRRASEARGERLDLVLNRLGLISDADLLTAYATLFGVPSLTILPEDRACHIPDGVSVAFLRHAGLLPFRDPDGNLRLAIADPIDLRAVIALSERIGAQPDLALVGRSDLEAILTRLASSERPPREPLAISDDASDDIERLKDLASEAPIIRLVAETIESAILKRASDIHITRLAEGGRIRLRIDGELTELRPLSPRFHQAVISRLKIMAGLDIGERRLPQDGRIQIPVRGREIDLRISTMPHVHGEGAFIRILDKHGIDLDLEGLGFPDHLTTRMKSILSHAHGLFLITGPTGSGKTTTLYAALRRLNHPGRHIVTVEDPIEYMLPGINQIQVNRRAGLDFATTLRSVLRQDPDIIMIGEIRDRETAAIAIQAALTGHFVLATLHTNSALSAVDRLVDMGVEPFLLAGVLRGLMAQRLVKRQCPACHSCDRGSSDAASSFRSERCETCHGTGSAGRMPLAEVVLITRDLEAAIIAGKSSPDLTKIAHALGFENLEAEGQRLVERGVTTALEVRRAIGGE